EGALDPAERRNRVLYQQAEVWRRSPPCDPVVAAGLVGGIPAMVELLSIVAGLEHGAVILPGLARTREAAEWLAIAQDESHPQHLMAGLLRGLDGAAADVGDWPPEPVLPHHSDFAELSDLPLFARMASADGILTRPALSCTAWKDAEDSRARLIAEALRPSA